VEGGEQKDKGSLCDEVNEQSKGHQQEVGDFCHELKTVSFKTEPSFFGKHSLCFSGSIESILDHGLPRWRGSEISLGKQKGFQ